MIIIKNYDSSCFICFFRAIQKKILIHDELFHGQNVNAYHKLAEELDSLL